MYKVAYRNLVINQKVSSWFSVEDIADLQVGKTAGKKLSQKTQRNS